MNAKKIKLSDTGERMVPQFHKGSMIYGEHFARYKTSMPFVANKVALDIACGTGYGSLVLSKTAKKVIGIDVDTATIEYAKQNYPGSNIEYKVGDCLDIPLTDKSVEVVITFETIEHVKDYEKFLSELKRVTKEDGLVVISTPNEREFIEGNLFHAHEFEYDEFISIMKKSFKYVESFFQADWLTTAIFDKKQMQTEWENKKTNIINAAPEELDKAVYFFLLCSDTPIKKRLEPLIVLSEHWSIREFREKEQNQKDKELHELSKSFDNAKKDIEDLANSKVKIESELAQLKAELDDIKSSRTWRLIEKTAKVRGKVKRLGDRKIE